MKEFVGPRESIILFNVWCGVGLARALFPRFRCAWRLLQDVLWLVDGFLIIILLSWKKYKVYKEYGEYVNLARRINKIPKRSGTNSHETYLSYPVTRRSSAALRLWCAFFVISESFFVGGSEGSDLPSFYSLTRSGVFLTNFEVFHLVFSNSSIIHAVKSQ